MDNDVKAKMRKLEDQYLLTQATLNQEMVSRLPPPRVQRQGEQRVMNRFSELAQVRAPQAAALVRLAYVRAMREVAPGSTLDEDKEREVSCLGQGLNHSLSYLEKESLAGYRRHYRHLITGSTMRSMGAESVAEQVERSGRPRSLEQRARASIRSIVEMAQVAGALAGQPPGSYDGGPQ